MLSVLFVVVRLFCVKPRKDVFIMVVKTMLMINAILCLGKSLRVINVLPVVMCWLKRVLQRRLSVEVKRVISVKKIRSKGEPVCSPIL